MNQISRGYNKRYLLLSIIPFVLFAAAVFPFSLQKPFNLDEADFASAAHGVTAEAVPLLSGAETLEQKPAALGLWHLPLYIYILAGAFKVFGESTIVARGLGLVFYIFTFIFLFLICKELFSDKEFYPIFSIAAILYLINPLLMQFSLLIDIDGGLLTLTIAIFSYFFVRFNKHPMKWKHFCLLGLILGISLLAKFTTPPLIIGAIFLYYALGRNFKKAFSHSVIIFLLGAGLAWLIWYSYCRAFKMPLFYPFQYTFGSKWSQGGLSLSGQKIANIKYSLIFLIYWVSPAFIVLMILGLFKRLRIFIKERSIERMDFLLILACLIWFFYFIYFPRLAMMKYQVPMYPLFIIPISCYIYKSLFTEREIVYKRDILYLFLSIAAFIYYFFCFPDMLLWLRYGKGALCAFFQNNYHLFLWLYFAPFFIFPVPFFLLRRKKEISSSLALSFLILTVAIQLGQNVKQAEDYTTANSWGNYGERGQKQTIDYLHQRLSPEGVAVVRKDIGYYLKINPKSYPSKKWIYNSLFRQAPKESEPEFKEFMRQYNIEYIQLDNTCSVRWGHELIRPYFTFDKQFDNFIIFKKR